MHFWVCLVIFGGGKGGLSVYIVLKACLASGVQTLVTAAGPVGEADVKFPGLGLVFLCFLEVGREGELILVFVTHF